ncbi:PilW family protein [Roseateles sp. LKC17W]|uniref:PilW family protein n=1 Tax=Pelomonas margarita TaxID=3299031 RepID=A0ABW7FIP4_9BURK
MQLMNFPSQRGMGLVELMVGITVGLIVAAGASLVAVNQITEHRRLMLETQIQQDLRTAADLLQLDIRRAGYRGMTERSVWAPPTAVGTTDETAEMPAADNNYSPLTLTDEDGARAVSYTYARSFDDQVGALAPRSAEHFGVKWNRDGETLYLRVGLVNGQDNWQPITDPDTVRITGFNIELIEQSTPVADFCEVACSMAGGANACPSLAVRQVRFTIVGEAKHDPRVRRTLSGVERVRADQITGACPA